MLNTEILIEEEGTIFINKDIFDINYMLETYPFRDEQLNQMITHSIDIKENKAPKKMLLKGGFATGKTSTMKLYFKRIEKEYSNVICTYINCQIMDSENEIFNEIYQNLFNYETKQGSHTKWLYTKIVNKLRKEKKILILGLDDIDSIKNKKELNNLLSKILRVNEAYKDVQIGLIMAGNPIFQLKLDPKVSTVFNKVSIPFPNYSKNQIRYILKLRCQEGFYQGVISEEVLENVVDKTFDEGNLRTGITLLCIAGENAEENNSMKILKKHLELD